MRQLSIVLAFLWVLLAGVAGATTPKPLTDRVLGDKNAPVTVIEYASLTCSHCAAFNADVLPSIKKNYIKTGKVRYVYRDFPLDGMALKAAQLARCLPVQRYYGFIDTLFRQQAQWVNGTGDLEPLKQIAALAGLGKKQAEACLSDTKLEEGLLAQRLHASNAFKIDATPTVFVGEKRVTGEQTPEAFAALLDAALAEKKK